MGNYDDIRLETKDGEVIAYFAPNFEVNPMDRNEIGHNPRVNRVALVRNRNKWTSELTIQGNFEHSEEVPIEHKNALESLFGKSPVTPQDQVNRLRAFTVYSDSEESLNFYHMGNSYIVSRSSEVDVLSGLYPEVAVGEIRTPEEAGLGRKEYMINLLIGEGR